MCEFAIANQAHYRIMFGRFTDLCESDPALAADGAAAFQVLLDALARCERERAIPVAADREALGTFHLGEPCTASPCCPSTASWERTRQRPTR